MPVSRTNLHRLRERLAKEFHDLLENGEPMIVNGEVLRDDKGRVIMQRPSAAMLGNIRQFLRDNGIDRDPVDVDPETPPLVKSLPFEDDQDQLPHPE